jgi:predicted nucleic acid-binding protein
VIVVSDSSPLIILSRAQQFDLLRAFYGRIAIPLEVYEEVTIAGTGLPGSRFEKRPGFRCNRIRGNLPQR